MVHVSSIYTINQVEVATFWALFDVVRPFYAPLLCCALRDIWFIIFSLKMNIL